MPSVYKKESFPFENEIKYNCPGKWQIPRSASINVYLVCFGASPYSGNCILQVWNYGSAFQPCSCPLCRRQINLLIPTDAASQQRNNSEVAEVLGKIERYNRHFGARSNGLIQVHFECMHSLGQAMTVCTFYHF